MKRYISKNTGSQANDENEDEELKKSEYLVTSMQIYSDHRDYFTRSGYEKHTVFNSEHLVGMAA